MSIPNTVITRIVHGFSQRRHQGGCQPAPGHPLDLLKNKIRAVKNKVRAVKNKIYFDLNVLFFLPEHFLPIVFYSAPRSNYENIF
jgi:hypothetical protein